MTHTQLRVGKLRACAMKAGLSKRNHRLRWVNARCITSRKVADVEACAIASSTDWQSRCASFFHHDRKKYSDSDSLIKGRRRGKARGAEGTLDVSKTLRARASIPAPPLAPFLPFHGNAAAVPCVRTCIRSACTRSIRLSAVNEWRNICIRISVGLYRPS